MKIEQFIREEVLLPRLKQNGVLVVYDPEQHYHKLCLELSSDKVRVIDTSESSITSRAAGLDALLEFGNPNPALEGILMYVPANPPLTDEDKQHDPYALYGACGAVFPEGDGDEFLSLCLKARADHGTEIRRIFNDNPNPSIAVIDAVGGGAGWPNLQTLLGVESARDILFALLSPNEKQQEGLKSQNSWISESVSLIQSTLGLNLKTRIKTWTAIIEELWRYLLFSEFTFDLPVDLPKSLVDVPRSPIETKPLVRDLCERLRNDNRTQALYIEHAEIIEKELDLHEACKRIEDFGDHETFPFEERACFNQAIDSLQRDNLENFWDIFQHHADSVWVGRGENQAQWALLGAAADLIQHCKDAHDQLPGVARSQEPLIDFYITSLREVDRLQREFEQLAGDFFDTPEGVIKLIQQTRKTYRRLMDNVQGIFSKHLEGTGWPPQGRLSNADVFEKLVSPKLLESGVRVAVLFIDALRYELGVELVKQLDEEGQADIIPAFAPLPTVTEVGMTGLLPGAGKDLTLLNKDGKLKVAIGERAITNVNQRMEVIRARYGQRFAELNLADFVRRKRSLPGTVELLVLRSNEMDSDFESNPEAAPSLISHTFQRIRAAIRKLRSLGFQDVLILTDHGFFLNTALEPGDVCTKPPGNWVNIHDRMLMGDGASDAANLVLTAEKIGVQGDFNQIAQPRAMVAYRAGKWYFHGGASLQEAIVPAISMKLRVIEEVIERKMTVDLIYKRGANTVTTRLPVIEVNVRGQADMFTGESSFDILLEAHDKQGAVIGEAKPGGLVNPASGTINVKLGEVIQVTLKMDLEFEGEFVVKALDPTTLTALGEPLELETDFMV